MEPHCSLEVFQEFTKVQRSVWCSTQFCGHQPMVSLGSFIGHPASSQRLCLSKSKMLDHFLLPYAFFEMGFSLCVLKISIPKKLSNLSRIISRLFKRYLFLFICMCACLCVVCAHVCDYPWRQEEGFSSLELWWCWELNPQPLLEQECSESPSHLSSSTVIP